MAPYLLTVDVKHFIKQTDQLICLFCICFLYQKEELNKQGSKDVCSGTKKNGPEELKQYFINLLKLEREAAGEITKEDLENFDPSADGCDASAHVEQESDEGFGDMDQKKEVPKHVIAVKEVQFEEIHITSKLFYDKN